MSKINIKYLSEELTETLRANKQQYTKKIMENQNDSTWIENIVHGKIYVEKKYQIEDFELSELLEIPKNATKKEKQQIISNNKSIQINNIIMLYERLEGLPRYILTEERFWLWLMFDKCYKFTNQLMPINSEDSKVFIDHWLFNQGKRRGIFFGVLSREFFRVDLTVDSTLEDKYNLSKFVLENPERFRNLSWRSISSEKHIVRGVIKAEMKIHEEYCEYDNIDKAIYYTEIAKKISKLGSVKLLDVVDENYIEQYTYDFYKNLVKNDILDGKIHKRSMLGKLVSNFFSDEKSVR